MLERFFPDWEKAKLILIGVDTHEFGKQSGNIDLKKRWNIPVNARIIISVSNLIPIKGIEILIKTFELLSADFSDWRLMIIGGYETEYAMRLKKN